MAPAAANTVPTFSMSTPAAVDPGGEYVREPDDSIELPEDVEIEDYLIALEVVCADALWGESCREPSQCCASYHLCPSFEVGGASLLAVSSSRF